MLTSEGQAISGAVFGGAAVCLGVDIKVVNRVVEVESVHERHNTLLVIQFRPLKIKPAAYATGADGSSPPGRHQPSRAGNWGRKATLRDD